MPDFVNTVDLIGDEALIDSIIDRSIVEIRDNRLLTVSFNTFWGCNQLATVDLPTVTKVDTNAFRACKALTSVKFPALITLRDYAFISCAKLTTADFPKLTSMGTYVFAWDGPLKTLILRSPTMCSLGGATSFEGTAIAYGTGYIYVPAALIEDYKAATNWSTYAARFRALEDYTVDGTTTGELDPTKI